MVCVVVVDVVRRPNEPLDRLEVRCCSSGVYFLPDGVYDLSGGVYALPGGVYDLPGGVYDLPGWIYYLSGGVYYLPGGVYYLPNVMCYLYSGARPWMVNSHVGHAHRSAGVASGS